MKKYSKLLIVPIVVVALTACGGSETAANHIGYECAGDTKSSILQKFGPPSEVIQNVAGAESWKYVMDETLVVRGGVKTYTFVGEECVAERTQYN